jgi:hypothetical protein
MENGVDRDLHARRVYWNEYTCRRLGLRLNKESNGQVLSLSVWQGELHLFHEWHDPVAGVSSYELHLKLEEFLLSYMRHLFKYRDLQRAAGHMILDLNIKPVKVSRGQP